MKLIQSEFFINSSDFLREAIKDKLKEHEIIEIREFTHDKAKKEILNYCEKTPPFDISILIKIK